jgi:protein-disulfide isomerase
MNISGETKFFAGIAIVTVAILIGAAFFFAKPQPAVPIEKLITSAAHTTGNPQAKVSLVEFSDFECPACGAAYPSVKQVVAQYKDQLLFATRNFPLDQHPNSHLAAEAAEAASAQGKYWEMHDLLFENQQNLSLDTMKKLAADLKLDTDRFASEVGEEKYKDLIQKDVDDGTALGVNSTPTFFLNGKKLNLLNFSDLKSEIDNALKQSK